MAKLHTTYPREVYIIDGARTPFLKALGRPGPFSASDLVVQAGRELLARQPFSPQELDEVIVGCVMPSSHEANIARIVSLRLGCPHTTPAYTVQRNCASGMQSIDSAAKNISLGRSNLVLVGGTEAMSRAPLLFNEKMLHWLADWRGSKDLKSRLKVATQFRPGFLAPVISLMNGLTDPLVGMIMGQTAEKLAYRFQISRESMDEFALKSHQRTALAQESGGLHEVTSVYSYNGQVFEQDNGVRKDSSLEKLAKLKPIFDKFGTVTAGNSSQVSDGAALLILASEEAVNRYKLPVLGRIIDTQWAGVEPTEMGLGPVHATIPLLMRNKLAIEDIDYWEINEAFAAQVLACLAAFENDTYCQENFGLSQAFGKLDPERLNIDGGAVALGHPVGASGARIVLHLLEVLKRKQAKQGVASICIGGGQGGAMLLSRG